MFEADTLYLLATAFSFVLILIVLLAKFWFGKEKEQEEEEEEDVQEELTKGTFGEWKQHKKALDQEYRDRFMDSAASSNDETPLIPSVNPDEEEDDSKMIDVKKTTSVKGTHVRFEEIHYTDSPPKKRHSTSDQSLTSTESEKEPEADSEFLDEDFTGILRDKLGENDLARLPGQLKSVKLRKATKEVEAGLTKEQKEEEARVRAHQLETIFNLMREQQEKFGTSSMEEIEEQLKLYNL